MADTQVAVTEEKKEVSRNKVTDYSWNFRNIRQLHYGYADGKSIVKLNDSATNIPEE